MSPHLSIRNIFQPSFFLRLSQKTISTTPLTLHISHFLLITKINWRYQGKKSCKYVWYCTAQTMTTTIWIHFPTLTTVFTITTQYHTLHYITFVVTYRKTKATVSSLVLRILLKWLSSTTSSMYSYTENKSESIYTSLYLLNTLLTPLLEQSVCNYSINIMLTCFTAVEDLYKFFINFSHLWPCLLVLDTEAYQFLQQCLFFSRQRKAIDFKYKKRAGTLHRFSNHCMNWIF